MRGEARISKDMRGDAKMRGDARRSEERRCEESFAT